MNNLSEPSAPTWWSFLRKMSHREQKSRKSAFDQKIVKIGYLLHWYGSPSVGAKLRRKNNGKWRPFCMKVKNAACATSISQWDMSPKVFIGGSHPITHNHFYRGPVCNWPTKKLGRKNVFKHPKVCIVFFMAKYFWEIFLGNIFLRSISWQFFVRIMFWHSPKVFSGSGHQKNLFHF